MDLRASSSLSVESAACSGLMSFRHTELYSYMRVHARAHKSVKLCKSERVGSVGEFSEF